MNIMYDQSSHPNLFLGVTTALREGGIESRGPSLSGGPMTRPMLDNIERYLQIKSMKFSIADEVKKWCDGRSPCMLPAFSDSMEIMNGQDPAADFVLLLYSAKEGDM